MRPGSRASRGGDPEAAREARTLLRVTRARAHDDSERFVDVYVWVFAAVLLTTWTLSFARETFTGTACDAGCVLAERSAAVACSLVLLLLGGLLLATGAVGPVSADRAVVRWLLGTTADRAVLLRGSLIGSVAAGTAAGAVVGMLGAVVGSAGGIQGRVLALGAAVGAASGAVLPLLLLGPQASDAAARRAPMVWAGRALSVAGLLLLAWVMLDGPGRAGPGDTGLGGAGLSPATTTTAASTLTVVLGVLTCGLVLLAIVLALRSPGHLEALSDSQLARGREVVDAVVGSTLMLDDTLLTGLQRRRQDRNRGRYHSAPLRLRGAFGFLAADLRMVRRRWRGALVPLLCLPIVLVVGEGLGYGAGVVLCALLAASAGKQTGQGLRTWVASPGLRRLTTVRPDVATGMLCLAPLVAAAVVAVPATLALGGPWWGGIHLALAALAATLRAAEPAPLELGAVVSTPAGAVPTGLLAGAFRGPDLALVLSLALVLRDEPWVLISSLAALGYQVAKDR